MEKRPYIKSEERETDSEGKSMMKFEFETERMKWHFTVLFTSEEIALYSESIFRWKQKSNGNVSDVVFICNNNQTDVRQPHKSYRNEAHIEKQLFALHDKYTNKMPCFEIQWRWKQCKSG